MDQVVGARRRRSHGDRRSRHELRPVVPLPPRARASRCTTSPPCRTSPSPALCHGDAWIGHQEREPGDGGLGPGARHGQRGRPDALPRRRTATRSSGAVVNLGALGVVTKVTLDIQPTFTMRQDVYLDLPLAQLRGPLRRHRVERLQRQPVHRLAEGARSTKSGSNSGVDSGEPLRDADRVLWRGASGQESSTRSPSCPRRTAPSRWGCPAPGTSGCPTSAWVSRRAAARSCSPSTSSPARTPSRPSWPIERLRDRVSPTCMISELRTIDADELWMSPCYQRPSLAIHFTWKPDWDSVRQLLPVIEQELAPYQVRPHWGKLFTIRFVRAAGTLRTVGRIQAARVEPGSEGHVPQRVPVEKPLLLSKRNIH